MSDAVRDPGQSGPSQADPIEVVSLRREALLPTERNRGLGTVAVVCTMAGVASGLALATTLMAMQVADSMHSRPCSRRVTLVRPADPNQAFLGVRYRMSDNSILIDSVISPSPASKIGLVAGDRVLAINGDRVDSMDEMGAQLQAAGPGGRPAILVRRRDGHAETIRPVLIAQPAFVSR